MGVEQSLTIRDDRRLRIFENRTEENIYIFIYIEIPKKEEVPGG
jgi:hypothetical protein